MILELVSKTLIMKYPSLFFLCVGTLIQSCASLPSLFQTEYTPIQPHDCEGMSKRVDLFFEGEPIDFSYSKLGMIEVSGNADTNNERFLDRLKYEASNQCANGIIAISNQFIRSDEYPDRRVFQGIAVAIQMDSAFTYSKILHQPDTSFIQRVELQDLETKRSMQEAQSVSAVVLIFGGLIALIASQ